MSSRLPFGGPASWKVQAVRDDTSWSFRLRYQDMAAWQAELRAASSCFAEPAAALAH